MNAANVVHRAFLPELAIPPNARSAGTEGSYAADDGVELRYQVVAAARPRHRLLYLHGIESHGGWFLPAAQALAACGCSTWLLDRRGSGLNRHAAGAALSADLLLDDIRRMRAHLGGGPLHLVGLSWGGKLATAATLDQPEGLRSLTLITPGLCSRVDLGLRAKAAVALDLLRGGRRRFPLPIRPEMFTPAAPFLDFIRADPWRSSEVPARLLWASRVLDWRIRRRIGRVRPPVLLFLAGEDRIIDNDGVLRLLARLSGQVTLRKYEHATHSIQLDHVGRLTMDVVRFLDRLDGPNATRVVHEHPAATGAGRMRAC